MLKVDLAQLERRRRVSIEEDVPGDALGLERAGLTLVSPIEVRLEAQQAGGDVVVRGRLAGEARQECRRCLTPVTFRVHEEAIYLFREDAEPGENEDVFPIPPRAREIDLTDAVREHVLLAVPGFVECSESCRGLCPRCGVNRNDVSCDCAENAGDDRWAALRDLKSD
jgi:uncharacterized protein